MYIIGSFFVIRGRITVGQLILFGEYFSMLFSSLDAVSSRNAQLRTNAPYYSRVFETSPWPGKRTAKMNGLCWARSRPRISATATRRRSRFCRTCPCGLEPGGYTALVGHSGCGKTTLAKLLLLLYHPDAGSIRYDGREASELRRRVLYRHTGMVMQDSYLFNMSIRENLLIAREDATEAELLDACGKASIREFVEGLPKGLDTEIGERGVRLSGGRRQRLAIARALLREPRLLLFDEATSSLDKMSEDRVNEAVREAAGQATLLVISHKPSAVLRAERIVVMDDGRVIDAGTHDELRARNGFTANWQRTKEELDEAGERIHTGALPFSGRGSERLRDWMAQGLDYPYILGHLLFNRMGERRTTPFRMPASFPRSTGNSAARWRRSMSRTGCAPAVTAAFSASLEDAPGRAVSICPPQGRAAGQPVSGQAAHLKRHGHPHSGTGHSRPVRPAAGKWLRAGVLRAGRFRPATRQEIISSRMNRGETVPFVRKVDLPGMPYWEIDINFTLDYQARDSGAVERLLEGRQARIETAEAPLYTLAPADFLLHLCAHLYKEASIYNWVEMGRDLSLYKFSDLYLLLREDLDEALAAEVLERAEACGLKGSVPFPSITPARSFPCAIRSWTGSSRA